MKPEPESGNKISNGIMRGSAFIAENLTAAILNVKNARHCSISPILIINVIAGVSMALSIHAGFVRDALRGA